MFDPKAIAIAQMRYEEMKRDVEYERMIQRPPRPTLYGHFLAATGSLLVRWGTSLQARHGNVKRCPTWTNGNRPMGRAL